MITEKEYINSLGELLLNRSGLTANTIQEIFSLSVQKKESRVIDKNFDAYILADQRKNTGSFYTPEYVAKYMVSKALFDYFKNNTSLSDERLASIFYNEKYDLNKDEIDLFISVFTRLKIADLSCGGGVFLINYMKIIHKIIKSNHNKDCRAYLKTISKNVHAYDINGQAIKSLLLELNIYFKPEKKEEILFINTHRIDIITSEAFVDTIPEGGFDIVIGNPPYLGEKGHKELFNKIRKSEFGNLYYEGKMDLFYYFIYRGINVLNDSGVLVYLTTNYFITADGAKKLRKFLRNNGSISEIINFNEHKLFDDARGQHNLIFSYTKSKNNKTLIATIEDAQKIHNFKALVKLIQGCDNKYLIHEEFLFDERNTIQLYINENHFSIIKKIKLQSTHRLEDFFYVNQGLVSGADRVSKYKYDKKLSQENIELYKIDVGDSIYVMNKKNSTVFRDKDYLKKFYKNSDINKFSVNKQTDKRILYIDNEVELDDILRNHLEPYREILEDRREVKTGSRKWYEIQWSRNKEIFEGEKIVVPQRSRSNIFAYNNDNFYGSADIYYITTKKILMTYPLIALLGLLNSKLLYIYLSNIGKKKGNMLELYATPLKHLLIKKLKNEKEIIRLSKDLINEFRPSLFNELNRLIYDDYGISEGEINFIEKFYDKMH